MLRIVRPTWAWNLHTHSKYSFNDALPEVEDLVATAVSMGQPALGLTDHGNMAGAVQLYRHCMKAGIRPFPGTELYVVHDRNDKKAKRYHMEVLAFTSQGYANLVRLNTTAAANFHYRPILDLADLAQASEAGLLKGLAGTSGCYFSMTSQALVKGNEAAATSLLTSLGSWFDRFYVEVQNHWINHGVCLTCYEPFVEGQCPVCHGAESFTDSYLADLLLEHATTLGLPVVLGQDAHYCSPADKGDHETLKRLVAWGPDADDAVFPGDGFHLADEQWFADHHHQRRLAAGQEGLADLLAAHDLTIPEMDSYAYNIPFTVPDPMAEMTERCYAALVERGLDKPRYADRLIEELEVIKDTGMAGYLILVAEVTDWCREHRVFYQARGSASGSLICYLLDITQADPVRWGLRYERFVSRDRTKPPDIDLDVEHVRRSDLMDWLSSRFAVHQIGTWLKYSLESEEDPTGEEETKGKGSLLVRYYARRNASGQSRLEWGGIPAEDKRELARLSARKVYSGYGVHAAGLVVTTTEADFARLVPMMLVASSKTRVTQYGKKDVEALGLVKLDVLGLKTLSVLHACMDNLGRDVFDGLGWIPLNDAKTFAAIAKGDTDGVFQLEGYAARKGVKDLKPTKVSDIVAAMALFRPAALESGATADYIERKHGRRPVPQRHPMIDKVTRHTFGVMVYQEQIIAILRELGMTPDDLTEFLDSVKASQEAEMVKAAKQIAASKAHVRTLADGVGMSEDDFEWLWHGIAGFSKYGFNQAHATAYGLTAYYCAYLSVHHPLEFYAALLQIAAGTDKEVRYVTAARRRSIRVLPPDINTSALSYAVDPRGRGVRRGLTAIKGVGEKSAAAIVAARDSTPFATMADFATRVDHRKVNGVKPYLESGDTEVGTLGKLRDAGALESLGVTPR